MALLQAARYYLLYNDVEKAKSFGLNRAIFYAWAKHRSGYRRAPRHAVEQQTRLGLYGVREQVFRVGDEEAFISPNGWFMIGGKEQRPEDYDREIAAKISSVTSYQDAWKKAIDYLSRFDKRMLESQREFYEKIYKPVRDTFL